MNSPKKSPDAEPLPIRYLQLVPAIYSRKVIADPFDLGDGVSATVEVELKKEGGADAKLAVLDLKFDGVKKENFMVPNKAFRLGSEEDCEAFSLIGPLLSQADSLRASAAEGTGLRQESATISLFKNANFTINEVGVAWGFFMNFDQARALFEHVLLVIEKALALPQPNLSDSRAPEPPL